MDPLTKARETMKARMPEVLADLRGRVAAHVSNVPRREAGYTIQNAGSDEAVVRIYDEIWELGVNALDLAADLDQISAPRIRVEINSPGGDVWSGIAIYNALRNHPAHVTTRVDGIAASIASVIAQAGDTRVMMSGSQMMIHNAWGLTVGDHTDHTEMAAVLSVQDEVIAGIYASRSGGDVDHFKALMEAETWMTAQDAVTAGLADTVIDLNQPADSGRTLLDEIQAAVDAVDLAVTSAERVDALRASAGKPLSNVNREGLVGLRDRIDRLVDLHTAAPEAGDTPDPEWVERKRTLAKRDRDFRAALPPHLV